MKLTEVRASLTSIRLICKKCECHQPAYVHLMIDKLGPDVELNDALEMEPCLFCKKVGSFTVLITNVE
jgi:hypothetical protein